MRRGILIALLCLGALVAAKQNRASNRREQYYMDEDDSSQELDFERGQREPKPFRAGHEYTYTYNTQIATGLVPSETSEDPGMPQQKAATRMQALTKIQFSSERHATLQLHGIRFGELNDAIPSPDRVKPMRIFEPKQIPDEKHRKLQLPAQFIYVDGVIERIQFHPQDDTWSKNIKRAVLNMLQLNLRKNNAQGLRLPEELSGNQDYLMAADDEDWESQPDKARAYTLPEITIEGECQTMYSIQKPSQKDSYDQKLFNVTKSIDFKQCRKIADVAYGYQTEQIQPQCAQCQQQWYKQQQARQNPDDQEQVAQLRKQADPCERQCDPKEVKESRLSRFTVQRYMLTGDQKQYAVKRSEVTSQYVFKSLNAQTGQYASAMHAVAVSELIFRGVQQKNQPSGHQPMQTSDKDETLLFSNQQDVDEKRFYMYGDEEYGNSSPFKDAQNKVQQAEHALQKLVHTAANKENGIEIEAPIQLQRLVEILRMCSADELKKIDRSTSSGSHIERNEKKEMAEQFFVDALAIAGTRNTIALLVEKILAKEITPEKAAEALRSLRNLPAPSDSQVKLVQRLCHSEVAERYEQLKQACWLTFGSMINELCQHRTQRVAQQTIIGVQSGFANNEVCPQDKKLKYREDLVQKFMNAQTTYQKVLALKAIGNAGIPQTVMDLEQIIQDPAEERIVRLVAIDSLRRLRVEMPIKIQTILMPIFMNDREQPELRMVAVSMVMQTLPSPKVIDQIVYALTKERQKHVLSFTYNMLKSIAQTKNHLPKEMVSKHIQSALKLLNVDDKALSISGRLQLPIYSEEQKEGVFLNLYSASSPRSNMLPIHLSAQLNSLINDDYNTNNLGVSLSQQNIDQWVEQMLRAFEKEEYSSAFYSLKGTSSMTRGQRQQEQKSNYLREIKSVLGIKSRRQSYSSSEKYYKGRDADERPFAMMNLRIGDIDQRIITINGGEIGGSTQQLLKTILKDGEKPSLSKLLAMLVSPDRANHHQILKIMATNLKEKRADVPTTSGLLLKALTSVPVIVVAEAKINSNAALSVNINGRIAVNVAHIKKLEIQLPIFVTGTASVRSFEINLPINAEVSIEREHGLQIRMKMPNNKQSIRVLGIHTLPTTFSADFDQNKRVIRETKMKAIHNENMEQYQREVNSFVGRGAGLPFYITGHFYRPSKISNYKQITQLLMAAENEVHVEFRPNQKTPDEIVFRFQGTHFERIEGDVPKFDDFYSKMSFDSETSHDQDRDFEEMDSHSQRKSKLSAYLANKYQSSRQQMYKHGVKIEAKCVGGESNCKAELMIETQCNPVVQICKFKLEAERTSFNEESDSKWMLAAKAQVMCPESVPSVEKLSELNDRNNRFIAEAEAEWGRKDGAEKQQLALRIQAEQAMKKEWRQVQAFESRRSPGAKAAIERHMTFLNKFDFDAEFKLRPTMQAYFRSWFDAVKAANYFNTHSIPLESSNRQQKEGRVRATLIIDPISQRHANVTVHTPTEAVRIETMDLLVQARPFQLVRPNEKVTHSVSQMLRSLEVKGRAECTVDGRRVDTFDDVEYKAPIGKCYSVLAKDCESEEPKFAVLMKYSENKGQTAMWGVQQKKIKVIVPDYTIECEPKSSDSNTIQCKVNGAKVLEKDDWNVQYNIASSKSTVQVKFTNGRRAEVTVDVRDVSVRFNGKKAWIKIAREYVNAQCGLCGHYDNSQDDEWRMSNNERTEDLAQFHRSYSLLTQEDCTAEDQEEFYQQRMFKSGNKIWRTSSSSESSESDENDVHDDSLDDRYSNERNDQGFFGLSAGKSSRNYQPSKASNKRRLQDPVHQTAVMESGSNKICFSMETVKKCPRGTFETTEMSSWSVTADDQGYSSNDEKKPEARNYQRQQGKETKNVKFVCLSRSSSEAREFLRRARRGEILDLSAHRASLTESVWQVTGKCVRY